MTETGFGGGRYAFTLAEPPAAPILTAVGSTSGLVTLDADGNPSYTEYAIYNATTGQYLDASGNGSSSPVWRTRSAWGTASAGGLNPSTEYEFKAKARNQEGTATSFGAGAFLTTFECATEDLDSFFTVMKASSTISAPEFMSGLSASILLAGKNLHDFGFYVDRISGLDLPKVVPDEELLPGAHTWKVWDEYFALKRIVLEGHVHGTSPEDLRLRLAYLKSFLTTFEGNPWRSTAPVHLERSDMGDRHWQVYYESIDQAETLGKRDISTSARVRVTMKCPIPYALSNDIVRKEFSPGVGGFNSLDLGNAPSDAVYVITGPAANPSFSMGDMVFLCNYADGLAFRDVENAALTGTFTPSNGEAGAYRTTETGMGILVTGSSTLSYTAPGNSDDGAWVVVFEPQWQSSTQTEDVVILEHRYDADNFIRLYWDGSAQAWVFRKRAAGADAEVSTPFQAFTAGTRIVIGITYDHSNAGGMKLFIDGVQAGVGGNTTVITQAPEGLTLHSGDGTMQPDAVFSLIAGWSRMLSADEMLKIATDTKAVKNLNVPVSYTGSLEEGDLLTLDSERKTAALFDVSAGTRTNVINSLSGEIPALIPGRRRTATDHTQTMIYSKTEAAKMEVRYRRRFL
ncbi:MAG: hypothetical protein Q8O92_12390 [Candidatus Latescibacter sp.]|nr:hypothetical protein [Candidatus Latescibacter sp.]